MNAFSANTVSIKFDEFTRETSALRQEHTRSLEQNDRRKSHGVVYTPPTLVSSLLSLVFDELAASQSKSPTFLDPSCGTGNFLVEAYRDMLKLKQTPLAAKARIDLLKSSLFGCDIDAQAVDIAKRRLWEAALEDTGEWVSFSKFPNSNFAVGSALSLLADDDPDHLLPGLGRKLWLSSVFGQKFDVIIGNPPYGKIRLTTTERNYFARSLYGHANTYGLFLHLGIEMLNPGGLLGYVLPASMLSGLYFQNLRKLIAEACSIRALVQFDQREKLFESVLQEVMLLVLQRESVTQPYKVRVATIKHQDQMSDLSASLREVRNTSVLRRSGGYLLFHLPTQDGVEAIHEKYEKEGTPLSDPMVGYAAKTGPIVWNRLKPMLRDEKSEDTLPLLWANNVGCFSFTPSGNRDQRFGHLLLNDRTRALITRGPCLLAQRTTAKEQRRRIIAAYPLEWQQLTGSFFVENHLNLIAPVKGASPLPVEYILALLNSRLFDFIFRAFNGNTQVSATELNVLRFAVSDPSSIEEVVKLVCLAQENRDAISQFSELIESIDQIVYRLYGLTPEEIRIIENHTQKVIE